MSFFADAAGLRDEACETFGHAISMGLNPPEMQALSTLSGSCGIALTNNTRHLQ